MKEQSATSITKPTISSEHAIDKVFKPCFNEKSEWEI